MTVFQKAPSLSAKRPPADETPHVEPKLVIWSILGFWAFYYVLNTARMAFMPSEHQLDSLPRRAVVSLVGIALTFLIYLVLRRVEGRSMRVLVTTAFLASVPV